MALQRLPVELLDAIFSYWGGSVYQQRELRILCRSFHKSLTPHAFKHLRLTRFHRDAFDCIVHLSQSPVATYVTTFEYQVVPRIRPRNIHGVDPLIDLGDYEPYGMEDTMRELLDHHQQYLAQLDTLGTYYDIISLAKAFPALRSLRSIIISGSTEQKTFGLWRDDDSPTRAFWGVVKALQHCEFNIESLTISTWHPGTLFDSDNTYLYLSKDEDSLYSEGFMDDMYDDVNNCFTDSQLLQLHRVVGNLTSLTLSNMPQHTIDGTRWQAYIGKMILRHCLRLETLSIHFSNNSYEVAVAGVFDSMLWDAHDYLRNDHHIRDDVLNRCIRLPRLRSLRLDSDKFATINELFTHFCFLHRTTLRSLCLRGLTIMSTRHRLGVFNWGMAIDYLACTLELESAQLQQLTEGVEQGSFLQSGSLLREWERLLVKGLPRRSEHDGLLFMPE